MPDQNNPSASNPPQDNSSSIDPLLQKVADLQKEKNDEENNLKPNSNVETRHGASLQNAEIDQLKIKLEEAQKQVDQLTDVSKRALADLENYRKRTEVEKAAFAEFANASLILELLPILDNFKRATAHLPEPLKDNDWVKGTIQIEQQLFSLLQKHGLKEMDALNKPFDPNCHEALLKAPGSLDTVVEILENGYLLGNKILRPAKVTIGLGEANK